MKIDYFSINTEDFYVSDRDEYVLIHPRPDKFKWNQDELHMRSLLVNKSDGEIISSGFPKFANYGEFKDHTKIIDNEIKNKTVVYTQKMDGSLIIRSIINGEVHFRTRGNHVLGEFESGVLDCIKENTYNNLLDPTMGIGESWLMEFVSPGNQIVIKYDKPELYFLGVMKLHEDKLPEFKGDVETLKEYSSKIGIPQVPVLNIPIYDSNILLDKISQEKTGEGIVVRGLENNVLVKMKCERYLSLHAMRYDMSVFKIREFIYMNNIDDMTDFNNKMQENGFDYEIVSVFEDVAKKSIKYFKFLKKDVLNIKNQMLRKKVFDGYMNRKQQVEAIRDVIGENAELFNLGISLLDGREEQWFGSTFLGLSMPEYNNRYIKVDRLQGRKFLS